MVLAFFAQKAWFFLYILDVLYFIILKDEVQQKAQEYFSHSLIFILGITQKNSKPIGLLFLEALPRFELGVKVLQTSALPLGYSALWSE